MAFSFMSSDVRKQGSWKPCIMLHPGRFFFLYMGYGVGLRVVQRLP